MWNNQNNKKWFPLCQTYKPTIILNKISKKWTNILIKWLIHGTKCRKDNQLQRCHLTAIGIPIIKIRQPHDSLIFMM